MVKKTTDGSKRYAIEQILETRWKANSLEYLIKWKGLPVSKGSWQSVNDLFSTKRSRNLESSIAMPNEVSNTKKKLLRQSKKKKKNKVFAHYLIFPFEKK